MKFKEKLKIIRELRKKQQIIGKKIKEYRLPAFELIAYFRQFIWFVFASIIATAVVVPTIWTNYTNPFYYLLILPVVWLWVVSIIKMFEFIFFVKKNKKCIKKYCEQDIGFEEDGGAPGTGKSYTANYLSHEKSKFNWNKLKYEMWKIARHLINKEYKPNLDEKEVIESYEFTINGDGAPLWGTNSPAYSKKYKRYSYDITSRILKQIDRAPYRMVGMYDEIGTEITMEMKDQRKTNEGGATDVTDFCKFVRQFGQFQFYGCEQDPNNTYKDFRRVVGVIKIYVGKEWVLKPKFLCWLHDKLEKHFTKKMYLWQSVLFGGFMEMLERYINNCGFFKFTYKIRNNSETGGNVLQIDAGEKEVIYIPRANEVVYRTRAWREAYKCKDKPIELRAWTSLYMTDERARSMLKSENLPKKQKEEKIKQRNKSEKPQTPNDVLPF